MTHDANAKEIHYLQGDKASNRAQNYQVESENTQSQRQCQNKISIKSYQDQAVLSRKPINSYEKDEGPLHYQQHKQTQREAQNKISNEQIQQINQQMKLNQALIMRNKNLQNVLEKDVLHSLGKVTIQNKPLQEYQIENTSDSGDFEVDSQGNETIGFTTNGRNRDIIEDDNYYDEIESYDNLINVEQQQVFGKSSDQNQYKNQHKAVSHTYQEKSDNHIQLSRDIQKLSMETFIQNDEQIQSDIKFCLYCIYNNHDMSQYFKQLLRIQKKMKEWSFQVTPNLLFTIFEENIKEFMLGIRDKIIDEMRKLQMIIQKPLQRRYSYDDYFLIDKAFSKSYSLHGYNNEILSHCMRYMGDSRYEQIRNDLRHKIWTEVRKSNEIIVPFFQRPEGYRKIFDMIIKFYTRVRESVIGIEEMWVFLIESVFQQELKGNLIFEQFHKQIFKKDILGHRSIQNFFKEIKDSMIDLEKRKTANKNHILDPIIENLNDILNQLDDDLNYQYPDEDETNIVEDQQQVSLQPDQTDYVNQEELEDKIIDYDEQDIITYQQLQERMREKYGGQSLAQQVSQYSQQCSSYQSILKSIQQDRKCQELMKNLPNLDTDTLCYIIENNLTQNDYEQILEQNQQRMNIKTSNGDQQQVQFDDAIEDIIISPSKDLNFLNQYLLSAVDEIYNEQNNYSLSNEDDDINDKNDDKLIEKKKKKNKKKKRKRKEKKILAQHQVQLEELLKHRLIEEQRKRSGSQLRKFLLEHLGDDDSLNLDNYNNIEQDEDDEELDKDSQFEEELEQFKLRLETVQSDAQQKRKSKLVPNIQGDWINLLRIRLQSDYKSPKHNSNKQGGNSNGEAIVDFSNIPEHLWIKFHQHSA